MNDYYQLTDVVAFPGWVLGVSLGFAGYRCWIMTPELVVLNDGEVYPTSQDAMDAGRALVELSLEAGSEGVG